MNARATDYRRGRPTWCPACGDYGVMTALQKAAANLDLKPDEMVVVTGIGCSGKLSAYFNSYGFHGIHGRALPLAAGIKLANRDLTVVVAGGDGDGYGIGGNHFLHACRRNVDIAYLVMDNHIYGLTKGQASPTSRRGQKTATTPRGVAEEPLNPLALAITAGASFVAQGFAGSLEQLVSLTERAIRHKGFALLNIYSPCVTFNKEITYEDYQEELVNLDKDPDYNRHDRTVALRTAWLDGAAVTGVLFQEERPTFEEGLPGYAEEPLARLDLRLDEAARASLASAFA